MRKAVNNPWREVSIRILQESAKKRTKTALEAVLNSKNAPSDAGIVRKSFVAPPAAVTATPSSEKGANQDAKPPVPLNLEKITSKYLMVMIILYFMLYFLQQLTYNLT